MSVSKNGKHYYTEEEKQSALENNNALAYARARGYSLKQTGNGRWQHRDHDSMVFKEDGSWFWNSQGISGGALTFMTAFEGMTFTDAVLTLANPNLAENMQQIRETTSKTTKPRKPFALPPKATDNTIVVNYLINQRCIDPELVQQLLKSGQIYQSDKDRLIMVGFDNTGTARYASERSTYGEPIKKDVQGSQKKYSFLIHGGTTTDTVVVVESPIEAMSYRTLAKTFCSPAIQHDILSLGGANITIGLEQYLQEHPQIRNIVVALNNDSTEHGHQINAGAIGIERIFQKFSGDYHISAHKPTLNDWNDTAVAVSQNQSALTALQKDITHSQQKTKQQQR